MDSERSPVTVQKRKEKILGLFGGAGVVLLNIEFYLIISLCISPHSVTGLKWGFEKATQYFWWKIKGKITQKTAPSLHTACW